MTMAIQFLVFLRRSFARFASSCFAIPFMKMRNCNATTHYFVYACCFSCYICSGSFYFHSCLTWEYIYTGVQRTTASASPFLQCWLRFRNCHAHNNQQHRDQQQATSKRNQPKPDTHVYIYTPFESSPPKIAIDDDKDDHGILAAFPCNAATATVLLLLLMKVMMMIAGEKCIKILVVSPFICLGCSCSSGAEPWQQGRRPTS